MTANNQLSKSDSLRERLKKDEILPLMGVYDIFSASLVSQYFEGIFCSGYGFSASHYGLPDNGHMTWSDLVNYVLRMRMILPDNHILVDVDDGFGDELIAADVIRRLEITGASAVIMEDQRRPKRCGHLDGKDIVPLDDYIKKLKTVIQYRENMFVLARTDATELKEGIRRAQAFVENGADAVMVEGLKDLNSIDTIRSAIPKEIPIAVNLIYGGKTPPVTLSKLKEHGINLVIYSTPCLFAAQSAITKVLRDLKNSDGLLSEKLDQVSLLENNAVLNKNAENRFNF